MMNLSILPRRSRSEVKCNISFVLLLLATVLSCSRSFTSSSLGRPVVVDVVVDNNDAAVIPRKKIRLRSSTTLKNNAGSSSSSSSSADNSYHSDLVRTLSKDAKLPGGNPMQRRAKPYFLRRDPDGAEKGIRMLRYMVEIGAATQESFQLVCTALLKRGRIQWSNEVNKLTCVANEIEYLLRELEELLEDSDSETVSTEMYNTALEAYANCANSRGNYSYAEKAEELYNRMGDDTADASSIFHVLRAWAWQQRNKGDSDCADKADAYLRLLTDRCSDDSDNSDNNLLLLAKGCDVVIEAYSKSIGGASSANNAYKQRLKIKNIPLPIEDYTNIILAWVKDDKKDSVEKATSILEEMSRMFLDGEITEDPEHIAYVSVIGAWNKANNPEKAEEILWLMENEVRPKTKTLKPDVFTYNSVCHAYIKDHAKITSSSLNAIARIIHYMENNSQEQPEISPDSYTYNTLLKAWNLSGNLKSVDEMVCILDRIENSIDVGMVSNKNFNVMINAYAKSKDLSSSKKVLTLLERMKASKHVEPDTITYTSAIECLTKQGSHNPDFAASKALELFAELKSIYETTKKNNMMPNSRTYSLVILALTYSSKKDKMRVAQGLLDELVQNFNTTKDTALRPTVHPYNYIINCAAKMTDTTGIVNTADRMETFKIAAKTYRELREHKVLKPDSYTYNFWLKTCDELLPAQSDLHTKFMKLSFKQCCKEGLLSKQVFDQLQKCNLTWELKGNLLLCDPKEVEYVNHDQFPLSWSRNIRI